MNSPNARSPRGIRFAVGMALCVLLIGSALFYGDTQTTTPRATPRPRPAPSAVPIVPTVLATAPPTSAARPVAMLTPPQIAMKAILMNAANAVQPVQVKIMAVAANDQTALRGVLAPSRTADATSALNASTDAINTLGVMATQPVSDVLAPYAYDIRTMLLDWDYAMGKFNGAARAGMDDPTGGGTTTGQADIAMNLETTANMSLQMIQEGYALQRDAIAIATRLIQETGLAQ